MIFTRARQVLQLAVPVALLLAVVFDATAKKVKDGVTQDVKLRGGRGPMGQLAVGDFQVGHIDGFKGAQRVAISVFNVAFPDENKLSANMHNANRYVAYSAHASLTTALQGVDNASRQRIADAAYAGFVKELKQAGYEVVEADELAKLAPEFTTWTPVPNFSPGRFGTYVAPTGRAVHFLQSDGAKRDTSGKKGELATAFRAFDRPQAFTRSPYLAHDAKLGIIAVTLVIDYGVYSSSGETRKIKAGSEVGFLPGVTVQSGTLWDTGTLVEYWGPKSGGFPAVAVLAVPVVSTDKFGEVTEGTGKIDYVVKADAGRFEKAAMDVAAQANAKLVGTMTAAR